MNARDIYGKLAGLVLAAWNDDADGEAKLEQATREAQAWFEEHDTAILAVLPLPTFVKFGLVTFIDNPASDKAQALAVSFAVQRTYDAVAFVADAAQDLFEDLGNNTDAVITFVLGKLGIKSDKGLQAYQREVLTGEA